ncbi:MAG: N-acetylgalactosamine-6-sulfatase, partial [Verrucomicrobia bacterium]|nr:N-acetylgalactosamine-6-sulfatase [Verrucomicrobiota bacterium]
AWAKTDPKSPWQKKLPIPRGAIQPRLGAVMDLYPTILRLTGVKNPSGHVVDGYDLARQLSGKTNPDRPEVFLMHFPHGPHNSSYFTSYRSKDWKLIYDYNPTGKNVAQHQLYNLKTDPFENENLAAKNPEKLQQMVKAMARQLKAENALYPIDQDGRELKPELP